MKSFFKKAKKFVGHDVWEKTEADFSSRKEWWFVRQARLILYTAQGVQHHNTVVRSAALTFFTLMSLVPMLALVLSYIRTLIANYASIPYSVLYAIGSFAVLWLLFAGAYKIIPNTKVRFRHAAMAALIAAIAFSVFQLVYVTLQSGVSSYNIIYGSFAAVPLFLFWIQASWQIVLFGAELSFSYQNVESFVQEQDAASVSYDNRRKVMLASLTVIIRSFMRGEGGISSEAIARELKLPVRLVRDINYTLDEAGMILPISSDKSQKTKIYVPARDIHTLTLHEAVRAVERAGSAVRDLCGNRYLREISGIMDEIDRKIDTSDDNILLMELIKDGDNDNRER